MKIGILTLPLHSNYGGILQAYALQTTLERLGHEVVVFHHDDPYKIKKRPGFPKCLKVYTKRLVNRIRRGASYHIFAEKYYNKEYVITTKKTRSFIDTHIHLYELKSFADIQEHDFDAFVVGSDQVWRPKYFKKIWESETCNMFLDFTKNWNVRRVAYAPSFGVDHWELSPEDTEKCKQAAVLFDAISVRELGGLNLCSSFLGVKAKIVLDPTMLLQREDYQKLIQEKKLTDSSGILLTYILDFSQEKNALIKKIALEKNLKVVNLNSKVDQVDAPFDDRVQISVEEWLNGFASAEFVVTDSFHACVFSIIFQKPFVVVGNRSRGMDRFNSLLKMFALEGNLLESIDSYNGKNDYSVRSEVDSCLKKLRFDSMEFLIEGLGEK